MTEQQKIVSEEIEKAGEAAISPELIRLDSFRITSDTQLQSEEFLIRMKGCPCFPRKDLSAITGQAKSGKTVLISILMACCVRQKGEPKLLDIERIAPDPLRVMWFDTEQSPHSTKNILTNRIAKLIDGDLPDELFYIFNIRSAIVEERYDLIAEAISAYQPDIVILDNIRDLVQDINDGVQAQRVIEALMHMAEEFNCHILTVLHQNRSADNRGLRGWLGTELMNKVFEVYACQKMLGKPGERPIFCVEQTHTRKFDIDEPIYYQLDEAGLPIISEELTDDGQRKYLPYQRIDSDKFNQDYIIHIEGQSERHWDWDYRKLFSDAIGNRATIGWQELMKNVMELALIKVDRYYAKVFETAEKAKIVRRDKDRCGRIVVMLLPLTVSSPSS